MGCRFATKEDRPYFLILWEAYLEEHYKNGCPALPTEKNLKLFRDYFDAYTSGQLPGSVVVWEEDVPVGIVMAGAEFGESSWEMDYGKLATLWGIYVVPEYRGKRIGLEMEQFGESSLVMYGFDAAKTTVHRSNPLGQANWRHWDEHRGVLESSSVIIASLAKE